MRALAEWQFWAIGSAFFAALTAILGKIGVEAIDSTCHSYPNRIHFGGFGSDRGWNAFLATVRHCPEQDLAISIPVRAGYWRIVALLLSRTQARTGVPRGTH